MLLLPPLPSVTREKVREGKERWATTKSGNLWAQNESFNAYRSIYVLLLS